MKKVAVVLVNYHDYAERFLADCRDSLRSQSFSDFEIYIVDNDSSLETEKYLRDNYPEAKILTRPDGNYSAANNLGFREAIRNGAEYLVTANMDTKMDKDWLLELVNGLKNNKKAGIVQSKILLANKDKDGKNIINSLGNKLHFLGFGFTSNYGEKDRELEDYLEIKGYASGCSFIARKDIFEKINGWNEEFYMYHDDIEFSLKVKLLGYKIILATKSVIYHKYEFSRSVKMFYYMERNRILLSLIFFPFPYLLINLPIAFAMNIAMTLMLFLRGEYKTIFKILSYFLDPEKWIEIRKERCFVNSIKEKDFSDVSKDFVAKIDFQEINNPILKYIANPVMCLYWNIVKKFI